MITVIHEIIDENRTYHRYHHLHSHSGPVTHTRVSMAGVYGRAHHQSFISSQNLENQYTMRASLRLAHAGGRQLYGVSATRARQLFA